jgi:hypothetical protein
VLSSFCSKTQVFMGDFNGGGRGIRTPVALSG